MDRGEGDLLCEELNSLISDGRGANPAGLGRLRLIAAAFEAASDCT
jgi:hypothetical protein